MARVYLLVSAVGLLPVALSYGIVPHEVLPKLMEVTVEGTDLTHVFRAIMGLSLGMIVLWILGAMRPGLTRAAVISEIVFMAGLAVSLTATAEAVHYSRRGPDLPSMPWSCRLVLVAGNSRGSTVNR